MKKILLTIGSVVALGGLGYFYVYTVQIPKITVDSVDWTKKSVTFTVRGVKHTVTASADGLSTNVPIKFSKYTAVFTPNQSNTNDVYRLDIEEGKVQHSQSLYFDFKNKKQS